MEVRVDIALIAIGKYLYSIVIDDNILQIVLEIYLIYKCRPALAQTGADNLLGAG